MFCRSWHRVGSHFWKKSVALTRVEKKQVPEEKKK